MGLDFGLSFRFFSLWCSGYSGCLKAPGSADKSCACGLLSVWILHVLSMSKWIIWFSPTSQRIGDFNLPLGVNTFVHCAGGHPGCIMSCTKYSGIGS